jgi:hypothetical protein
MSQSNCFRWVAVLVSAGFLPSCAMFKDARFAESDEPKKGSELLGPMTAEGEKRMMDIRSTYPRQWPGLTTNPQPSGPGGMAETPSPILTGMENFEVLPSAANGLFPGGAESNEPAWHAVPASPLRASAGSAAGSRLTPDYGTIHAVVNALPALTGASLAEPYVLANLTARSAPAMAAAFSGAAVEATPSPVMPASSGIHAPAAPVFATAPPPAPTGRSGGEPEASRPRVVRMLTSEHEAE